ncbi:Mrp/NBP35 family ATP-binding protein [Methanothermobacter tenebrarum]
MDEEHAQKLAIMKQDMEIAKAMFNIKHKVVVMSGKGGVGKTTVTIKLAEAFKQEDYKVCILDADLHGPNVPKMMNIKKADITLTENKINPVTKAGIGVVSIEFFLPSEDSPIIWRGPRKTGAIRQLLADVNWDNIDILLVDNPPGTGDEPLTVLQSIPNIDGVIIITTPHDVSLHDVKKCINMVKELKIPIIGIIENMSYIQCPKCGEKLFVFGKNGGRLLAEEFGLSLLGRIPLDTSMGKSKETPTIDSSRISKNIIKNIGIGGFK